MDMIEGLTRWVEENPRARGERYETVFLGLRSEIEAAMGKGYRAKSIWSYLRAEGRMTCNYDTFLRYVRRYIRPPEGSGVAPGSSGTGSATTGSAQATGAPPAPGLGVELPEAGAEGSKPGSGTSEAG